MQNYKISYKGQKIFTGIDVHRKNWQIAALTEAGNVRKLSMPPSAKALFEFLNKNYPDGTYLAAYETGFSGFSTYYALEEFGIRTTVVHAADVPTTQYESVMKTDVIDAEKLARALKAGLLRGIYIREKDNLDDRSLVRTRQTIMKQLSGCKSRVKHMLHSNGVEFPGRFAMPHSHWSGAFISWLKDDVRLLSPTRASLDLLILHVETIRKTLLHATREMRRLSQTERYRHNCDLLMSVPGIGIITAMCILTEVYDVTRFRNEKEFASYLGLIPTCHCSGDTVSFGEKTFRGNKKIGPMLVEASWSAILRDHGLGCSYSNYKQRMTGQEAIIRIARKMSNIIFAVLKSDKPYVPYQFK